MEGAPDARQRGGGMGVGARSLFLDEVDGPPTGPTRRTAAIHGAPPPTGAPHKLRAAPRPDPQRAAQVPATAPTGPPRVDRTCAESIRPRRGRRAAAAATP